MTTDSRIATDLAALARVVHHRVPPFAVPAAPAPARAADRPGAHHQALGFAHLALVACSLGLLGYMCSEPVSIGELQQGTWFDQLMAGDKWRCGVAVGVLAAAAYGTARLVRRRPFGRRALIVLDIVGPLALFVVFGETFVAVSGRSFADLREPERIRDFTLAMSEIAIDVGVVGAILIAARQPRSPRAMIVIGSAIVIATVFVGIVYDVGPLQMTRQFGLEPSMPLRIALTATGTAGLVLALGGIALLRARRRT